MRFFSFGTFLFFLIEISPIFSQSATEFAVRNNDGWRTWTSTVADMTVAEKTSLAFQAVKNESRYALEVLLDRGVDLLASDEVGKTLLLYSLERRRIDIVRLLAARGCDDRSVDFAGNDVLIASAGSDSLANVAWALTRVENVDRANGIGKTALMEACANGSLDIARLLVRQGADVERVDFLGRSVSDHAKLGRNEELVAWIEDLIRTRSSTF